MYCGAPRHRPDTELIYYAYKSPLGISNRDFLLQRRTRVSRRAAGAPAILVHGEEVCRRPACDLVSEPRSAGTGHTPADWMLTLRQVDAVCELIQRSVLHDPDEPLERKGPPRSPIVMIAPRPELSYHS